MQTCSHPVARQHQRFVIHTTSKPPLQPPILPNNTMTFHLVEFAGLFVWKDNIQEIQNYTFTKLKKMS